MQNNAAPMAQVGMAQPQQHPGDAIQQQQRAAVRPRTVIIPPTASSSATPLSAAPTPLSEVSGAPTVIVPPTPQPGSSGGNPPATPRGAPLHTARTLQTEFIRHTEGMRKRLFINDLRSMMYGFGDDETPLPETMEVMDDLVTDFIFNLAKNAVPLAERRGRGKKFTTEDVLFLVRKVPKMYFRAKELIKKQKEIEASKKVDNLLQENRSKGVDIKL